MAYNITGTAGNDTLNQSTDTGPGTITGLAGDDTISLGTGSAQVIRQFRQRQRAAADRQHRHGEWRHGK